MAREEPQGGLPRNYLRPCLLLMLAEGATHGYDLIQGIASLGVDHADQGGLYRALRAMEQEGLVTSWWEHSDVGPARRTYALTADGADWLHAWAGTLRLVHGHLGTYLDRYAVVAERGVQGVIPAPST